MRVNYIADSKIRFPKDFRFFHAGLVSLLRQEHADYGRARVVEWFFNAGKNIFFLRSVMESEGHLNLEENVEESIEIDFKPL